MHPRFFLTLLLAASSFAASGCATAPPARSAASAQNHSEAPPAETLYPAWTKAAGWLLLPFTGASGNVNF